MAGEFARAVVAWQKIHGRHGLPWQHTGDPYRVWLSEVMLQQTQVAAVIPYYLRFLEHFPDVAALAAAPLDDVLRLWSGLGYYSRARNLHRAAQMLVTEFGGAFPQDPAVLARLPGIGRSTAAAVAALAFGRRAAILDGNVKRVLSRHLGVAASIPAATERLLWAHAERLAPATDAGAYTQGLMDLGAAICRPVAPACGDCPVRASCVARRTGRVADFPPLKVRKTLPGREVSWLILGWHGSVLLVRRPPVGVWAGLWAFPELPPGEDAVAYCQTQFGADLAGVTPLTPMRHGFSHYSLRIHPQDCTVAALTPAAGEEGRCWLAPVEAVELGVPAPVRGLLRALAGRQQDLFAPAQSGVDWPPRGEGDDADRLVAVGGGGDRSDPA